jgi:hypothetical protein
MGERRGAYRILVGKTEGKKEILRRIAKFKWHYYKTNEVTLSQHKINPFVR